MHRLGGRNEVRHLGIFLSSLIYLSSSLISGRPGQRGGDEDVPRLALPTLLLHLAEPEGQPEGAHPEQARQPWRVLRLHVLWETPFIAEQPSSSHITGETLEMSWKLIQ